MWKIVLSLLSGPLRSVSNDLKEAYQARLNAENDTEKVLAQERIAVLEARKTTIMKAQSDPVEKWIRVLLAVPFVVYINKLVLWDKVFGLGVTDGLSQELTNIMWVVLAGYFADTVARRVMNGR